ncbi:cupin domain-containing protein [Glycomyces tarimensis]
MRIIVPKADDVIRTSAATMTGLAAPSRGSTELSTWKVRMESGADGVEHVIDREQVWMVTSGSFEVVAEGRTARVSTGEALVLPAEAVRTVRAADGPAEALVAMAVGGRASRAGSSQTQAVPWAL